MSLSTLYLGQIISIVLGQVEHVREHDYAARSNPNQERNVQN